MHGTQQLRPTLDHIHPKSAGGTITYRNTVAACHSCNQARGIVDAMVFYRLVLEMGVGRAHEAARKLCAQLYKRRDWRLDRYGIAP